LGIGEHHGAVLECSILLLIAMNLPTYNLT